MVQMIACSVTNAYRIISSWTPSSLLRRADDPLEGTHVANSLSLTKGFLYVVPMRRKSEVLQVIKQFTKEIGAPPSIIADMSGEQMSHDI